MGYTRSFLKSIGLNDEQIEAAMEEHTAVTDALKKQRDSYKEQAEKAGELQKKLDEVENGEDFKAKWEKEHQDFEDFKKKTESDATAAKIRSEYRKLLAESGISEKRLDSILKVTDISKMKLDKDGNLEGIDDLKKSISSEWGDFVTTVTEKGAVVEKPLQTGKAKMTREEIFAIKDTAER